MRYNIKYSNIHSGGEFKLAEFLPYSDHYKMSEEFKQDNPNYCPDLFPYLCNKNSIAEGKCRKLESDCNFEKIYSEKDIKHLTYKKK